MSGAGRRRRGRTSRVPRRSRSRRPCRSRTARARAPRGMPRPPSVHHSSGSCSARPGCGCTVAIGARARPTSSSPRHSAAFVALVPRSRVKTTRGDSGTSAPRYGPASCRTTLAMAEKSSRPYPAWLAAPRSWRTTPEVKSGVRCGGGEADGEVEVLRHQVGHEPRRPPVRRRAVGHDAFRRQPGAHRDAVAGGVRHHLVELREVDAGALGHHRGLGRRQHLRGVDEVVAQLHDLAHARSADVHDQPREGIERGPSRFERRFVATHHQRERALLRARGPARQRRLEVARAGLGDACVLRAFDVGIDGRRVDDDLARTQRRQSRRR